MWHFTFSQMRTNSTTRLFRIPEQCGLELRVSWIRRCLTEYSNIDVSKERSAFILKGVEVRKRSQTSRLLRPSKLKITLLRNAGIDYPVKQWHILKTEMLCLQNLDTYCLSEASWYSGGIEKKINNGMKSSCSLKTLKYEFTRSNEIKGM